MNDSIEYIYDKSPSLLARLFGLFLSIANLKHFIERSINKNKLSQQPEPMPGSLRRKYKIDIKEMQGRRIWILTPKQNVSDKVILYMHGGAYIFNITKYHWHFIEKLLNGTSATIIVPDYPLAPAAKYNDVYNLVNEIYIDLLSRTSRDNIIFMGDSAGGGFVLGFAQELRKLNSAQPSQIILLSPWLDLTMSNSDIINIDNKDKILGIKGLQLAGEAYAGSLDLRDNKLSPIYGSFSGLGKICIFSGTNDILFPDVRKLKYILDKESIPINYFEYTNMFHDWMIFTALPESQLTIKQIESLINEEN